MADILYTYKNQVYANITNRCDCSCTFCVSCTGIHCPYTIIYRRRSSTG